MTLLALAGNIGGLAAIGFDSLAFSSPPRAAAPMPKPDCLKKCRRVAACSTSPDIRSGRNFMAGPLPSSIVVHFQQIDRRYLRAGGRWPSIEVWLTLEALTPSFP